MKLLVIILKNESLLEQVTSALVEAGLYDSSVLDGENIETLADASMPLFTSFKNLFGEDFSYNRTVISPVRDPRAVQDVLDIFEQENIDFTDPDTGTLMTIPCVLFNGDNREDL